MADRFFIGPYDKGAGLQSNFKPWVIPDQAFSTLNNAYVWRGRVRKRYGSRWIDNTQESTRLRVKIGTAAGNVFNGFVPRTVATVPIATPSVGQMFSIGTSYFTVNIVTPGVDNLLRSDGLVGIATFDTSPLAGGGAVSLNNVSNLDVYYYPALPVMGLLTYDQIGINEITIAFDTRFAYNYISGGWERLDGEAADIPAAPPYPAIINVGASVWNGSNSQLFYGVTWVGDNGSDKVFLVTNFNELEPNSMRYLDNNQWNTYRPLITNAPQSVTTEYLFSARILTVFHNHVIALNTWEGTALGLQNQFQNRARWTGVESPTNNNPGAWRQDIPGHGSGLDAATTEGIIGIEFVQDRLIVYFERSTWELVYTGNPVQPFTWQQINTELGCQSTFSVVPFDKMALGIADVGVHSCNGIGVERIDSSVPELVDDISNDHEGAARVYGIRDYTAEMVYWAYPDLSTTSANPFPNRTLLYNYVNGTWATNDDVVTAFGYFQKKTGILWDSKIVKWDDDVLWNTGGNNNIQRVIIAGNQQGFTYLIDQGMTTNAPSLQITDVLPFFGDTIVLGVMFNCLKENSYVFIKNVTGTGTMTSLNGKIFQITVSTQDTITITLPGNITGVYSGGGTVAVVSNMNITTKQYSFYLDKGANSCVNKIDFQVKRTGAGQIGVQFMTSSSPTNLTAGAAAVGSLIGNGTLVTSPYALAPYEKTADMVIHSFYTSVSGSFVQMTLTLTPTQMLNTGVMGSDFQLHSFLVHANPTNRLQ